ncbi:hypothetical protein [Erythrobacter aureus]|uniref:Uncharacterized protein n=1 Tax=Erythrobacter aureus TaxID=2182384 RepID=A0A345YIS8_9SPHN|nr:hypothetical protein [Erythrobacter aureus]AXK43830.1 hypothetical protein DVR09_15350 [Erythrobacter aureus]
MRNFNAHVVTRARAAGVFRAPMREFRFVDTEAHILRETAISAMTAGRFSSARDRHLIVSRPAPAPRISTFIPIGGGMHRDDTNITGAFAPIRKAA